MSTILRTTDFLRDRHLAKLRSDYVVKKTLSRTDLIYGLKDLFKDNFVVLRFLKSWDYSKQFGGGPTAGTGSGMA